MVGGWRVVGGWVGVKTWILGLSFKPKLNNYPKESHQLNSLVMGSTQWQMDNHLESLQGEKLGDCRLWSGEKLPASRLQDFVLCMGPSRLLLSPSAQ